MMNSIISLNDMISKALECVDAERNAKTRKKSHTSKSRKQDFSRAKRHAKHCQYKQQRNEKLVHPAINRNAQRSIDEANCKLMEYILCIDDAATTRPYYVTDEEAAYRNELTEAILNNELTEAILKAQHFFYWGDNSKYVDEAYAHGHEMLDGLSLKELKLIAYISSIKTGSRKEVSVYDTIGYDDAWWPIYGYRLIDPSEYCWSVINEFGLLFTYEENRCKDCREGA